MENSWGTQEEQVRQQPSTNVRAELTLCTIGAVCLSAALVAVAFEHATRVELVRGVYSILAAGIVIGVGGWVIAWSIGQCEARVKRCVAVELADLRNMVTARDELLAELTSKLEIAAGQLDDLAHGRTRSVASCRPGTYLSKASQGDTVGIRPSSVDAATDPSGVTLQRVREDGIETGFEIGYRAQLAERGVTSLPRARRPRLTGDS